MAARGPPVGAQFAPLEKCECQQKRRSEKIHLEEPKKLLIGSLDYLSGWKNWNRDDGQRGSHSQANGTSADLPFNRHHRKERANYARDEWPRGGRAQPSCKARETSACPHLTPHFIALSFPQLSRNGGNFIFTFETFIFLPTGSCSARISFPSR